MKETKYMLWEKETLDSCFFFFDFLGAKKKCIFIFKLQIFLRCLDQFSI